MHYMVEAYTWAGAHTVTYLQVFILVLLLFVVWSLAFNRKPSVRRELQMDLDRKSKVRGYVRDAYVNALYDMMRLKHITYAEYQREMLRLRKDMGFDVAWRINLHPQAIKAELEHLKDAIKRRLPEEKVQEAVTRAKQKPTKGNGKLNLTVVKET